MSKVDKVMDRRTMLRTAGLAGIGGVLAPTALAPAQSVPGQPGAQTPPLCTAGSIPSDLLPPPEPAGLSRNAPGTLVDNRYRITYERSVPATVGVLTQHFAALSERNLEGIADTLHYPFAAHENFANNWPNAINFLKRFPRSKRL